MHAARACHCRSIWQGSTCREGLGRRRMVSKGRREEGGGIRQTKTCFKWWDMSRRASLHTASWPLRPSVLFLYGNLSIVAILPLGVCPGYPFFCIICCLPVVDMTSDRLWERRPSPQISRCVSHTLVSNASYSSLLKPPINLRMSECDRERERETEREEGRGRKKGALERAVYFARLTENSPKCWVGIMLSNIDCDFLGEKQPALVNLEWLWNNLDPPPHIVECQKRNALQQFRAALQSRTQTIENDKSISKFLQFKNVTSLTPTLHLCLPGSSHWRLLRVCMLVQRWPEPALCSQMVYQWLIIRHLKNEEANC